ncbi:glycosyltransferase [Pedobacter sp. SYSU D00535]|uniref:glycosyltransferase n=1 Tax=Pedobacter sp. SYSU D00535 TaxID=2810308 RepID=UPI001A95A830|nr:glycosyltransferase [Pedobacter sp. SYSU D00535]
MVKIEYKICVVTVTYGDRWEFLRQVLKRVLGWEQVSQVIVVDNASVYSVTSAVSDLEDERVLVSRQEENLGSAGGYKKGLELASQLHCDFVFLLDDDNLPDEDAAAKLVSLWAELPGKEELRALYCLREDRVAHIKIASGQPPSRFYLTPNNFLGFDLFRIPVNQFYKLRDKLVKKTPFKRLAEIPYAPYGGLFFKKSLLKSIGYPDERFYLYVDDSEYTYRITKQGGTIWLVTDVKVNDIDKSQGIGYKGGPFRSILLDCWSFRTYYHVRNMIYFNRREAVQNKLVFKLNKHLYLTWLKVLSRANSKDKEYQSLKKAVDDGLQGSLGRRYF